MMIAAGMMYGFLMVGGNMKPLGAAYCCARAFVLAEFAASLQWQMVSIVQAWGNQSLGVEILITMVVFGGCFTIDIYLEKAQITKSKDCNSHDCRRYYFLYCHLFKIILLQKIFF